MTLSTFLGIRGGDLEGTTMRIVLVVIAGLSWISYIGFRPIYRNERRMLFLMMIFGVLFLSTQYSHSNCLNYKGYIGQLLRWGSDCVSGCLIGMILTKCRDYSLIHKILPWECIALTPFMAFATVSLGATQGQMHLEGGMNYQTVSYAMAELFSFSFFYLFIYDIAYCRIKKILILITMLIQASCCAMSGGRGGLVLLVVYIVYFAFYLLKNNIVSKLKFFIYGILIGIALFIVADCLGVFDSSGFARSSNSLNDDDRFEVWAEYWKFIDDYPIFGYGLGGDYFTVGFYSHNMIVDFLLELGIIGLLIMPFVFFKTYKKVYLLTKQNTMFVIVMILFLYGLVMNMFSGYWISMNTNWLCFGVAMTASNYYLFHKE